MLLFLKLIAIFLDLTTFLYYNEDHVSTDTVTTISTVLQDEIALNQSFVDVANNISGPSYKPIISDSLSTSSLVSLNGVLIRIAIIMAVVGAALLGALVFICVLHYGRYRLRKRVERHLRRTSHYVYNNPIDILTHHDEHLLVDDGFHGLNEYGAISTVIPNGQLSDCATGQQEKKVQVKKGRSLGSRSEDTVDTPRLEFIPTTDIDSHRRMVDMSRATTVNLEV